jgi:transposase
VRKIRRRTRRKFSPDEKIRIVIEGLRGEQSVSELSLREGIASNLYYRWSQDFLEAGKKQLAGDTVQEAASDEVRDLRSENRELKEVVAGITPEKLEIIRLVEELTCRCFEDLSVRRSSKHIFRRVPQGSRRWLRRSP